MTGLFIAADLGALGEAARGLSGAVGEHAPVSSLPHLGHPEADSALGDFHHALQSHAAAVSAHAAQGAASMHGYILGFRKAGG